MKTSILATFIAFALGISLASAASAAICDKHEQDKKAKRGKTAAHVKTKRGKSKAANLANASRKPAPSNQLPASAKEHHDHSAHSHHSGHDEHSETPPTTGGEHQDSPGKVEQSAVKMNIPDLEVVDQDNRRVKFYSDLVKGKTVAINFIFTTCTTICTPLGATFARVQKELKAAANND
ncbi:MAG: SCO family protein, partial [Acidobacteriota bacterium]|nr:SCO family protein [Acidobacteriota bacterium]